MIQYLRLSLRLDEDSDLMDLVKASVAMAQRIQLSAKHSTTSNTASTATSTTPPRTSTESKPLYMADHNHDTVYQVDQLLSSNETHFLPERYQFLLRDLRLRLQEMERHTEEVLLTERHHFATERAELLREKEEAVCLSQEYQTKHSAQVKSLKDQYEKILQETRTNFETLNQTVTQELAKCQEVCRATQEELKQEKAQHMRWKALYEQQQLFLQNMQFNKPTNNNNNNIMLDSFSVDTPSVYTNKMNNNEPTANAAANNNGNSNTNIAPSKDNDFLALQKQLTATQDTLEDTQRHLRQSSQAFQEEILSLKNEYDRYKKAHEILVTSLEEQVEELQLQLQQQQVPPEYISSVNPAYSSSQFNSQNVHPGNVKSSNFNNNNDASILSQSSWSLKVPSLFPPAPQVNSATHPSAASLDKAVSEKEVFELQMEIQRLQFKYHTKCTEFDALMRYIFVFNSFLFF